MLVAVGGHSRNIGKTSVVAGLIAAMPGARWCAVKITQHGHGVCAPAGTPCGCAVEYEHPYAISEEHEPNSSDSGRYLAAGAARSYWLRTAVGQLGHGMPVLRELLAAHEHVIVESNSVLQFLRPDLYVVVLDYSVPDMKESARLYLDRADALVLLEGSEDAEPPWRVPARWLEHSHRFIARPPKYVSEELAAFVGRRLWQN